MADYVQANTVGVQTAYTKESSIQANMVGVQVAYLERRINPHRIFPIPTPETQETQQNQVYVRSFPL